MPKFHHLREVVPARTRWLLGLLVVASCGFATAISLEEANSGEASGHATAATAMSKTIKPHPATPPPSASPASTKAPATTTSTTTTTTTIKTTTATTPTATGSTVQTPKDLFDLSGWNLTLPVDALGGTGGAATTVSPAQLLAGFSDEYFELNSDNQLVFTAPSTGATTANSSHTRSELHEYYTGPGAATNGCWLSSLGGTLQASVAINAVPVDSAEATIGQIHGNGAAVFALLIYRPATQQISLKVYASPTTSTYSETVIEQNVLLGSMINYQLSFKDGIITATVNGKTATITSSSVWDSYPVRFDVGAYSAAPNTGNPAGDKTEVAFSSFSVSH
jgi:Alginate lyase